MVKKTFHWLPALLYASLIFWISHQSRPPGAGWAPDALGHLLGYAGFTLTLVWGKSRGFRMGIRPRRQLFLAAVGILYGISDELHQSLIPGRVPSLEDVAVDAAGVALGLGLAHVAGWTRGR